jgi:hypothetical protein
MSWRNDRAKSVAGTMGGIAGPMTGTVTPLTQENYHLRSDVRDRDASNESSSGPTTGTHIIYQMGPADERLQ